MQTSMELNMKKFLDPKALCDIWVLGPKNQFTGQRIKP